MKLSSLLRITLSSLCFVFLLFPVESAAEPTVSFVHPLMGPRLTSKYGMRTHPILRFSKQHSGIDLAAPIGAPIRAVADGQVVFADPFSGFGKLVVIQHKDGFTSHYAHCSKLLVNPGRSLKAGQIVAEVGNTGHSTGPHLHLEIRKDGKALNPEKFIPGLLSKPEG